MTTNEKPVATPYDAEITRLESVIAAKPGILGVRGTIRDFRLQREGYLAALAAHGARFCGKLDCGCYVQGLKDATPPDISAAERAAYGRGR